MPRINQIPSVDQVLPRAEALANGHRFFRMSRQCRVCGSWVGRIRQSSNGLSSYCAYHHKHKDKDWIVDSSQEDDVQRPEKVLFYIIHNGGCYGPFKRETDITKFIKKVKLLESQNKRTDALLKGYKVTNLWEGQSISDIECIFPNY